MPFSSDPMITDSVRGVSRRLKMSHARCCLWGWSLLAQLCEWP